MKEHFSPSADRNKAAILEVLKSELSAGELVLEIGSGTGQHACFFASEIPEIIWQPTELADNLRATNAYLATHVPGNIRNTIVLDVDEHPWPVTSADVCYTSNTFHIMSLLSIGQLLKGCSYVLGNAGKLCVYGPFFLDDKHVSQSNAEFDRQLQLNDPAKGVRDLTVLDNMAQQHGFKACRYSSMPANNLFIVWER